VHRPGVPCHSGFLCVPLKGQTECVGLSRLYILQEPSVKAEYEGRGVCFLSFGFLETQIVSLEGTGVKQGNSVVPYFT
jgi:hypothetical protein